MSHKGCDLCVSCGEEVCWGNESIREVFYRA